MLVLPNGVPRPGTYPRLAVWQLESGGTKAESTGGGGCHFFGRAHSEEWRQSREQASRLWLLHTEDLIAVSLASNPSLQSAGKLLLHDSEKQHGITIGHKRTHLGICDHMDNNCTCICSMAILQSATWSISAELVTVWIWTWSLVLSSCMLYINTKRNCNFHSIVFLSLPCDATNVFFPQRCSLIAFSFRRAGVWMWNETYL